MSPERLPANDPREWLNRASSSLIRARTGADTPGVYLEDLCFDAQQAAEKAIKAVLTHLEAEFPYVHDLAALLTLVERAGTHVPETVRSAAILSDYAVATRYPGVSEAVTRQEYEEAVATAAGVVAWAREVIAFGPPANSAPGQPDVTKP